MTAPGPAPAALLHSSFYRFTPLADPLAAAQAVRGWAQGLTGLVVLAPEGISGAVAGAPATVQALEAALVGSGLLGPAADLAPDGLRPLRFKHSGCQTAPFGRLKVTVKPEIVSLSLPGYAELLPPDEHDASHLTPAAWRELMARGEAVLLDNRNHFEWRLGHFRGAADPAVHHFRDFVAYVEQHAPAWRAEGRPVAMYCTGGVRCDKTAPWMRSLGLQVLQLEGGIVNYLATMPDAALDWQGECFVFDKRIALDTRLQETATRAVDVFDPSHPDEAWRLARADRLDGA
ncbi:MAG: hypothetical protein LW854_10255 [Rubrivivax sp.]|jgi:UPF0176 protein|nr:hypothetical protein [Rubrivivax sp.]